MNKITKKIQKRLADLARQNNRDSRFLRIKETIVSDKESFNHFSNHRDVNWSDSHSQYDRYEAYSVR